MSDTNNVMIEREKKHRQKMRKSNLLISDHVNIRSVGGMMCGSEIKSISLSTDPQSSFITVLTKTSRPRGP